jgi:hypothetical protein
MRKFSLCYVFAISSHSVYIFDFKQRNLHVCNMQWCISFSKNVARVLAYKGYYNYLLFILWYEIYNSNCLCMVNLSNCRMSCKNYSCDGGDNIPQK